MIDLLPNDEQQAIADNIAEVLAAEAPVSRLRDGQAEDTDLQSRLAALGWIGMGLPEEEGGVGYGCAEEVLLFRSAGRHLLGPGLLAATLSARLAAHAGAHDIAARLVSGEAVSALFSPLETPDPIPGISGCFQRLDGDLADYGIVLTPVGAALIDNATTPGESTRGIDDAVRLDRIDLHDHPVRVWATSTDLRLDLHADLLIAATLTGIAEGARDLSVEYAKMREQFGQPIGAFQAIKHMCADMAVRCEAAWSLTVFAAMAMQDGRPDAEFQILSARTIAEDAALLNAAKTIQVHGGIGFTAECDAQLFLKRARLWSALGDRKASRLHALLDQPEPVRAASQGTAR